jgi:hypothetical protein
MPRWRDSDSDDPTLDDDDVNMDESEESDVEVVTEPQFEAWGRPKMICFKLTFQNKSKIRTDQHHARTYQQNNNPMWRSEKTFPPWEDPWMQCMVGS